MWSKLVFLAPFALTTTASDKTTGEILADPTWGKLGLACLREACAVAVAEGAKVDADAVIAGVMKMPGNMRSSMQKDVEQHKTPELEAIAGPILRGAGGTGLRFRRRRNSWPRLSSGRVCGEPAGLDLDQKKITDRPDKYLESMT